MLPIRTTIAARRRVYSPHTPAWLYCRLRTSPSDIKIPCTGCRGTFRTREVLSLFLICYRYVSIVKIGWLRNCCKLEICRHDSSTGNVKKFWWSLRSNYSKKRAAVFADFELTIEIFSTFFFFNFSIDPFINYTFLYITCIAMCILYIHIIL